MSKTGEYQPADPLISTSHRLTPTYSYLPYNLGLVYQRLNRRKEAEASYRKAMSLAPDSPEPYNALGTLKAVRRKIRRSREVVSRRTSTQLDPALRTPQPGASACFCSSVNRRQFNSGATNLANRPTHLPSRLSLAETLAASDDHAGAIEQYRAVLAIKPDYPAARVALAGELSKSGNADGALAELHGLDQADALELIGDIEKSRGRLSEAKQAYTSALAATSDRDARSRIRAKLKATS